MLEKTLKITFLITLLVSCDSKKGNLDFFETEKMNVNEYYKYNSKGLNYYQYKYFDNQKKIKYDSFLPVIYTNVRPLKTNKKIPEQIFDTFDFYKDSRKYYFYKLKQKSVIYIENNGKILYRSCYHQYYGKKYYIKDIEKPRNLNDLIEYLKYKNINYKIIDTIDISKQIDKDKSMVKWKKEYLKKEIKTKVYYMTINKNLYKVELDSSFCETKLFYNPNDTINNDTFNTIIVNNF